MSSHHNSDIEKGSSAGAAPNRSSTWDLPTYEQHVNDNMRAFDEPEPQKGKLHPFDGIQEPSNKRRKLTRRQWLLIGLGLCLVLGAIGGIIIWAVLRQTVVVKNDAAMATPLPAAAQTPRSLVTTVVTMEPVIHTVFISPPAPSTATELVTLLQSTFTPPAVTVTSTVVPSSSSTSTPTTFITSTTSSTSTTTTSTSTSTTLNASELALKSIIASEMARISHDMIPTITTVPAWATESPPPTSTVTIVSVQSPSLTQPPTTTVTGSWVNRCGVLGQACEK